MPDIRAGDRERERTATDLGQALAQGYLPMAEYEDRLGRAFAANSTGELDTLVADLPVARLRHHDPRRRTAQLRAARLSARIHLVAYLAGSLLMLGIWLAGGLGGEPAGDLRQRTLGSHLRGQPHEGARSPPCSDIGQTIAVQRHLGQVARQHPRAMPAAGDHQIRVTDDTDSGGEVGHAHGAGGMHIMPAGMHDAGHLGAVRGAAQFFDGKSIHIRPHGHAGPFVISFENGDDAVLGDAGADVGEAE